MTPDDANDLDYFLRLAAHARFTGRSSGEKRAWHLAHAVLSHAPGLDATATRGLVQWIHFVQAHPTSAADILRSTTQ